MGWRQLYNRKLLSKKEAALKIASNSRVVLGHAAGTPVDVIDAMVDNKEKFKNVEIVHMLSLGEGKYMNEDMEPHFRHNAIFVGGNSRKAIKEGRADYTPCFFYEVPRLFKEENFKVDVAIVQLSKPDNHGYCSFGVSCDYTKPATEAADIVIAEVNDKMPRVMGENFIHISDIDYIVETSNELYELPAPNIGDVEKKIGENCAKLIDDGSTLQLGIGAIPDAVLMSLGEKKDLGVHTEMFSDGVLELIEKGVINGKAKTLHKNKMISTFLMGSKKLYEFIDNNPSVELYPVDYVNHPCTIMKNDKMISINSCIQVDLMGQVVSESIGLNQFSGVGGQVDYVRGSSMAREGKSIIAIPSTASKGRISRIVPFITEGSAVTTSRNDVHYIVTEYGIANLRGKTLKERAKALINIAHPDFRKELEVEYNKRFK
ncbi:acetyl-CoA hydrolase/transferase family protein [Dethiothermospora halolimnae]|uniref:acetyl-CoA hydrolase/transferase family protein n=1 Tax=Dethiothermospora halolimnae TaxID=3114390 RepID=UPI003CCC1ADF